MLSIADIQTCDLREGALILVDKPSGWTSFDVVNKVRWAIRKHLGVKKFKVGHSGTLDPMATGLLLLCIGKWTKKLNELQGLDKVYTGTMTLGAITPSYDAETEPFNISSYEHVECTDIVKQFEAHSGDILQVPPIFSAIKVDGTALYKRARKGEEVKINARPVTVHHFKLINCRIPEVDFEVSCSKGTYIRSLAYDVGQQLGCGAYLSGLCRTAVGPYLLEDAWSVNDLVTAIEGRSKTQNLLG